MRFIVAAIAFVLVATTASGQALTASMEADGYSFALDPTGSSAGFTFFFTTYDGSSGVPLGCGPQLCTVNGEVSPVSLGSSSYRTDYLAQDDLGILEYGTVSMSISTNDGDGDGLPDGLERLRSGNFTFSGTAFPHFNVFGIILNSTISGSMSPPWCQAAP